MGMTDYYAALGVSRTATAADIKQAFRKLASQHHPDKGGDTKKFQEIQAAYAVLGDEQKRAEYDNPRPQMHQAGFGGGPNFNFNDIFEMFGARFTEHPVHQAQRQSSSRVQIWISLEDAAKGGPRMIGIATNQGHNTVEIVIPAGIEDGDNVRYGGIGPGGSDIVVLYRIQPSANWQRQGADVTTDLVIPLWDLILGKSIAIDTVSGTTVEVTIAPGTQPGTVLRVRGYGMPRKQSTQRGDMMIKIQTRLPDTIPEDVKERIRQLRDQ
jgi:DnaJ-class molecular chaperone